MTHNSQILTVNNMWKDLHLSSKLKYKNQIKSLNYPFLSTRIAGTKIIKTKLLFNANKDEEKQVPVDKWPGLSLL